MRIKLVSTLLLLPALLSAQERVTVKGRIINEQGEAVEYVQVGVPKHQIGTISTFDGRFEITVPCDTLEFFHVSYEPAAYAVTGATNNVVVVLHEQELPPAVFIGGDTQEKYLLRSGKNLLGSLGSLVCCLQEGYSIGKEVGSVARAKKPFLVQDILFSVQSSHIPGCVASINIYRIEGEKESFANVLHKPIYFDVAVSDNPREYDIQPEEPLLLEPGQYFIAFQVVDWDEGSMRTFLATPKEERKPTDMCMFFGIHLKSSYLRDSALGKMQHLPVNIGIAVKGLEYQ